MDIADFHGLFKFKLLIPAIYVLSWIGVFLGPSLFPVIYQRYCMGLWLFLLGKMIYIFFNMTVILVRTYKTLKGYEAPPLPNAEITSLADQRQHVMCDRYYAFVIPNFKQDLEIMNDTLSWLASHSRSRNNYLVFLAMEKHQEGSEQKAAGIISEFRDCFRVMEYTCHQIREHEQKGKASNVSWCVQHMEPYFKRENIPEDKVFLTIIDVDSWVPPIYIDKVEQYYDHHMENQYISLIVPAQIFTRNYLDVPVFTRIYDHTHSFAHLSNMRSCTSIIFPISNYTVSYKLMKRIGFWDTCADAIGEDFHTTQKAFWKTGGELITVPIYTPFNQLNIQTGQSYWADIQARFWQAERHAQGVSDLAYSISQMIKTKVCGLRAWTLLYYIFECFAITATIPWASYSVLYQNYLLYRLVKPSPELYTQVILGTIMNSVSLITIVTWVMYQIFKRNTNRILYKRQNQSPLRMLEYPIIMMIDLIFITVPVFIVSAFGALFKERQYHVAQKVIKKDHPLIEPVRA